MAEILAGQIVRAVDLNYPRVYQEPISGGPTSGTTELELTGSLVIPAQPIDCLVVPSANWFGVVSVVGDIFSFRIRQSSVAGTERAIQSTSGGNRLGFNPQGPAFPLAAGTPLTLVATIARSVGTGNINSISGNSDLKILQALVLPDRS